MALLLFLVASPWALAQNSQSEAKRAYFSGFDGNGDLHISRDEYLAYLSRGFDELDANGDGVLDAGEVPATSKARGSIDRASHRQAVSRSFDRLDRNRDGRLDLTELIAPP